MLLLSFVMAMKLVDATADCTASIQPSANGTRYFLRVTVFPPKSPKPFHTTKKQGRGRCCCPLVACWFTSGLRELLCHSEIPGKYSCQAILCGSIFRWCQEVWLNYHFLIPKDYVEVLQPVSQTWCSGGGAVGAHFKCLTDFALKFSFSDCLQSRL